MIERQHVTFTLTKGFREIITLKARWAAIRYFLNLADTLYIYGVATVELPESQSNNDGFSINPNSSQAETIVPDFQQLCGRAR